MSIHDDNDAIRDLFTGVNLTPCPDCGDQLGTRCDCDHAGIRVQRRIAMLEADKAKFRTVLRDVIRYCGGQTATDVSDEFLLYAADEVRLKIDALEAERDELDRSARDANLSWGNAVDVLQRKLREAEAENARLREELQRLLDVVCTEDAECITAVLEAEHD